MASTECIKECNCKTGVPCWFCHELLSDLDQTIKSSQNFIPFLLGIIFQALYLFPVQPSPTQVNNNCLLRRWGRLLLPFQTIPLLSSLSPSYFNICFSNHPSTLWTPQTLSQIQVLLVSQGQFHSLKTKHSEWHSGKQKSRPHCKCSKITSFHVTHLKKKEAWSKSLDHIVSAPRLLLFM